MYKSRSTRRQAGFTLVELLIVAIILAILAAIIVPQFASTTSDAKESALRANVTALRSAIELYRQQHGVYPGKLAAAPGVGCTATAGSGAVNTEAAFTSQLTLYSDKSGKSCSAKLGGLFPLGPYVQDDVLPANPITDSSTVAIVTTGDLKVTASAGLGWKFDSVSGKFIVNDSNLDSQGVAYSTY